MMRKLLAALLFSCLLLPGAARAELDKRPPEFIGMRVGFAGRYKAGLWTPVELRLRGGTETLSGRVRVWTADSDGVPCSTTTPEPTTRILPGQETLVRLCVRFGHVESSLRAEFQVGERTVAEKTFATGEPQAPRPQAGGAADAGYFREAVASQALIVQVGPEPLGLEEAVALTQAGGEPRAAVARLDDAGSLPAQWQGYEGVDAVVLATAPSETFHKIPVGDARIEALDRWVRMGGTLVLCAGAQAGAILREGAPLARFAPGPFQGVMSLPQTGALEAFARSQNPIPRSGPERGAIHVARLTGVRGKIEAAEADLPLVVRTPRGFGQVVFFAADLDRPPLSRWSDRKLLLARLLDLPAAETPTEDRPVRMHYGYADIAGQLRSALDRYAGVRLVPFSAVALLAVLYILCIGPGDYFFLRKFLPRMEWTWLTFPAIVLGLCGGAYVMAHRLKGDQLRVCQADLVDVDASGSVRGTSWMHVFSPRMETFNLVPAPRLPDGRTADAADTMIAWLGLPGDGLGGMYQTGPAGGAGASSGAPSGWWSGRYSAAPGLEAIQGVPIPVWSSKSFTARWTAQSQPGAVETLLVEEGRVPRGTVTNRLGFPLADCILAYDRYLYDLGTLEPGRPLQLGPMTRSTELAAVVQGPMQSLFGKTLSGRASSSPYDPASVDVLYILRAMTFFEAVDGRRQTGLVNDYQPFVDLSGQLLAGRAVLVACPAWPPPHFLEDPKYYRGQPAPYPGADLLRDGRPIYGPQDQRTTVLRFVLEVRPSGGQ